MSNSSFFDFHCPTGGNWYACAGGNHFVGCCTSDPCTSGCVQGDVRAGGYNISHYGEFPGASCNASEFYSCNVADTFWGCCKSNPCVAAANATCSKDDLVPAFMDTTEQFNAYVSASASPSPAISKNSNNNDNNTGAIAGGVAGGVVGLAIVGVLIFFLLRRQKRKQRTVVGNVDTAGKSYDRLSAQFGGQSPTPPTYSQDYYQTLSPTKGHYQQQYANIADAPQELSAEHRYSELPAETTEPSELESPRPLQTAISTGLAERANQGLDVTTEEATT